MRVLLILVLSVCLLLGIGFASLFWWFDDDDYRRLGQWLATTFLDAELTLGPEFEFSPGRRVVIKSSQATFRTSDASLAASIEGLNATIDLFALRHGTILVEDLSVDAGEIHWKGSDSPAASTTPGPRFLPLVQRASIRDLGITLDPAGGTEHLKLKLSHFDLDEPVQDQPLALRARGTVNGRELSIDGSTGSQRDFFDPPPEGFRVDLSATGPVAAASLSGYLADPIRLTGAELTLTFETKSIQTSLAAFVATPALGTATLTTRLTGDLRDPQAEAVQFRVSRPGFSLAARGTIGSLYAFNDMDLSIYTSIDPAQLDPTLAPVRQANLEARLTGADGVVTLTELDGFATLANGGDIGVGGDARWSIRSEGGSSRSEAPTAEFNLDLTPRGFDPDQYAGLPALLKGLHVVTTYSPAGITPERARLHTRLRTIEDASLHLDLDADLGLDAAFEASSLTLGGTVGLPDGTGLTIDGQIDPGTDGLQLTRLNIGDPASGAHIEARGHLGSANPDGPWGPFDVDVTGTGDAAHLLTLLDLDAVHGVNSLNLALQLRGTSERLQVPQLSLDVGGDAGIEGRLEGHIDSILPMGLPTGQSTRLSGVDISGRIRANSTTDLGKVTGRESVPDLGALQVDGRLTDTDGTLGLEALTIRVTRNEVAVLALSGAIGDIFGRAEIHWAGAADIDLSALLENFVDPGVDLGSLKGDFVLSDEDGSFGIDSFTLTATADTVHSSKLSGSLDDFTTFADLEARADIDITDTRLLNRLLGDGHGIAGPMRISGTVDGDPNNIQYQGTTYIGRNQVGMELSVDLDTTPVAVNASIVVPELHPADLGLGRRVGRSDTATPDSGANTGPAQPHLFSRTPLDLTWLDRLRADLQVLIKSVKSDTYALENLDVRARIARGELTLDRWDASYSGGSLSGTARLANSSPPAAELKIIGDDVAFGELMELVFGTTSIRASMSTRSELSTQGMSLHEMASNLAGEVGLVLEHGVFPRRTIDLIGVDVFGWTMGTVTRRRDEARFECAIGRFSIDAGVLTAHALFLDGPNIAITGAGTIDLGAETIDARFVPRNKRRFWGNTTPVHLTGSLVDPTVTAIPARALAQEVGTLALVPQFYLPARALGFMFGMIGNDDEDSPCLTEQDREALTEGLPD